MSAAARCEQALFQRHQVASPGPGPHAHLKDCARVLSAQFVGKIDGERAFSTRVINGVYLDERQYWLPIRRPDGTPLAAPDGTRDKAIHVRGRDGKPLNALKQFEFVASPSVLEFTLKVLGRSVSETDLHLCSIYEAIRIRRRAQRRRGRHISLERRAETVFAANAPVADDGGAPAKNEQEPRRPWSAAS
jgi:hypothetical protein